MKRRDLGIALRSARRRVFARLVRLTSLGVYCAIAGPLLLAPVCGAVATLLYLRRGITILQSVRNVPAASPIIDIVFPPTFQLPAATALPPRKTAG